MDFFGFNFKLSYLLYKKRSYIPHPIQNLQFALTPLTNSPKIPYSPPNSRHEGCRYDTNT